MYMTYDKELTAVWLAKAQELGITVGEFEVDGVKFFSEEITENANGSNWSTLNVYANGEKIYWEEHEIEEEEV